MTTESEIFQQVTARAAALLPDDEAPDLDVKFIKQCLDENERGDGVLYASLHRGRHLFNTTPEKGEWYTWNGNVWTVDNKSHMAIAAVEQCSLEYLRAQELLQRDVNEQGIAEKRSKDGWMLKLIDKYASRINRLRSENGAKKCLSWAPIVDPHMSVKEEEFDQQPWLIPVLNGVINMRTGMLESGRPEDRLTRAINIEYDPRADYRPWQEFVTEIADSEEVANFIRRSFGYAATGNVYEQFIWVFTGPGRNGKGLLFNGIGSVLGPYYHELNPSMLLEQRFDPSPGAASEHLYSLFGKRIIVGSETNKGQKTDLAAIKRLTGDDPITCRPNFRSEMTFLPTHSLFLRTNHVPIGFTADFAMAQRFLKVEFPWRYVDDVEAEKRKYPNFADRFRKKDPRLKDRLMSPQGKQAILKWLVDGCLEWQQVGISPPQMIIDGIREHAREEDYISTFYEDALFREPELAPGTKPAKMSCTEVYHLFCWWWSINFDPRENRVPALRTLTGALRERGFKIEKSGGRFWLFDHVFKPEFYQEYMSANPKS